MIKAAVRSLLRQAGYLKARYLFGNRVRPGSKVALSADVRYSELRGHNAIGRRSIVHKSTLGEFSYVGDDCRLINVDIGRFASIGSGVKTAFGRHPYHYLSQHPATYSIQAETLPLTARQLFENEHTFTGADRLAAIGHDVWIGDDVKIFDGVTIGDGAVVGTNSLVTRAVPPYAIVRGSPAQVVRYRFSDAEIQTLLRLQWWSWDLALLRRAVNQEVFRGPVAALEQFAAADGTLASAASTAETQCHRPS
jgi:acetyltransferase-like isoleucine patch superfamily enzyme